MADNPDHWLMRPDCGEGASVSGSSATPRPRVHDHGYIRSLFEDAPSEALHSVIEIARNLLRKRGRK